MYYFTAIERFDPGNGERWVGYTRWLGRTDLKRIVTLDSLICPPVVHVQSSDDWQFVAQEEFMLDFFTSLDFVLRRISGHRPSVVVATARNPSADDVAGFPHPNFEWPDLTLWTPSSPPAQSSTAVITPERLISRNFQWSRG